MHKFLVTGKYFYLKKYYCNSHWDVIERLNEVFFDNLSIHQTEIFYSLVITILTLNNHKYCINSAYESQEIVHSPRILRMLGGHIFFTNLSRNLSSFKTHQPHS